jgi:hypothetical protein
LCFFIFKPPKAFPNRGKALDFTIIHLFRRKIVGKNPTKQTVFRDLPFGNQVERTFGGEYRGLK